MSEDDVKTNVLRKPGKGATQPGGSASGPREVVFGGDEALRPSTQDQVATTLPTLEPRSSHPSLSGALAAIQQGQPAVSRQFGRYELLLELASGGMATLYLARLRGPEGFEKLVALKIIHAHLTREATFVEMFFDEARIAAKLQHPNVVQVLDLGQLEDTHFIAMEYVHGKDYRALLKAAYRERNGPPLSDAPSWLIAARVAADAAAGLHAAHELVDAHGEPLHLVHRDISPHNILLSYDGHVKITDFGIAYAKHRITHTDSGVLKGKVAYMAPEQAEGESVDRRADIFALGIVLWEAVCQKRLFRRDTDAATLRALLRCDVPPPSTEGRDVPRALDRVVLRALAADPGRRYQTAHELGRDLERLIAKHHDVIGATELSGVMQRLFSEQRARLDQEIAAAVSLADAALVPSTPIARHERTDTNLVDLPRTSTGDSVAGGVSETRLSAEVVRTAPPPSRRSSPLTVTLIAAAALVIAGVAGYLLLRERTPQRAPTRQAQATPPDARARSAPRPDPRRTAPPPVMRRAPSPLLVTFVVKPTRAKATILFRGKRYRQNQVDLLLKPGQTAETVRVEAPGYEPLEQVVTVRQGATLKHTLRLKRRRRVMRGGGDGPVDIGLD